MTRETQWRKLLAWLRRHFPATAPVVVRRKKLKGDCGQCWCDGKRFFVEINRAQCYALVADTLLHEWAHVLTLHGNDTNAHGEEWGLMYARLYREYIAWNYGRPHKD